MSLSKKKPTSTIKVLSLSLIIVVIQILLSINVLNQSVEHLISQTLIIQWLLFPIEPSIALLYFLMPMVLCAIFSSSIHPKQIISPFHINAIVLSIVSIIIIAKLALISQIGTTPVIKLVLDILASGAFLMVASFGQVAFVQWVVRQNLNDVDRLTYLINADYRMVLQILDNDLLQSCYFERKYDGIKIGHIYKRVLGYGDSILIIVEPVKTLNYTKIATLAYKQYPESIERADTVSKQRDSFINDLKVRLAKIDPSFTIEPTNNLSAPISQRAYSFVEIPTRSKTSILTENFKKLPTYHQVALTISIIALVSVVIAYLTNIGITIDVFVSLTFPIMFTLIAELGLSVREELQRRKSEENIDEY